MIVAYDSMTGNVKRFIKKIQLPSVQIREDMKIDEDFILVTYTTGFGYVPEKVNKFLEKNYLYLRGVSASGNRNWGENFAASADKVSGKYHVPIVSKFELAGTNRDVEQFMEGVGKLELHRVK